MTDVAASARVPSGWFTRRLAVPTYFDSRVWAIPAIGIWIVVLASSYVHLLQPGRFMGDLATYFAPVRLFQEGFAGPYVGFIDIKPPLLFGLTLPVAAFTDGSLLVFFAYDVIWWLIIAIASWSVLRRLVRRLGALVFTALMLVLGLGLNVIDQLFFTAEVPGLAMVLLGLALLLRWPRSLWAVACAAALMVAAGQVKEIYLLTPLTVVPWVVGLGARWWRGLLAAALGGVASVLVCLILLGYWGAIAAYRDILILKSQRFPAPGPAELWERVVQFHGVLAGSWQPLASYGLLLLVVVVAWGVWRHRIGWRDEQETTRCGVLTLCVLLGLGLLWLGTIPTGHYAIPLVWIVVLLPAAAISVVTNLPSAARVSMGSLVISALLIISALPGPSAATGFVQRITAAPPQLLGEVLLRQESEESLQGRNRPPVGTDCVLVVHGWDAASVLIYSKLPPCSPFVLTQLELTPEYYERWRLSLQQRPAPLVWFEPAQLWDDPMAGLSTVQFEAQHIGLSGVIQRCYQREGDSFWWTPKPGANLATCWTALTAS